MSNFDFMINIWPELANNLKFAEKYLYSDPNTSLFKVRSAAEQLLEIVLVTIDKKTDLKLSHLILMLLEQEENLIITLKK